VKSEEIVSGYQFDEGKYVIIDTAEIDNRPSAEKAINVSGFVGDDAIDARYFSGTNYYLTPDGPVAVKTYALLHRAMAETGRHALGEIVMSGRKSLVLVRPLKNLLSMSFLCYATDLKKLEGFTAEAPRVEVSPDELKLAKTLMESLSLDDPDMESFRDDYSTKLNQLIETKIAA
jgi:DNA end-binding protein Ku